MRNGYRRRAISWLDLLVALAIIALLIAIMLPSLARARQQAKRAVCMSNLKSLVMASHAYAVDDQRELILPMHMQMVQPTERWYWKTVNAFAWGGRSAPHALQLSESESVYLNDIAGQGRGTPGAAYAASTRPLNRYVYGDLTGEETMDLKMYQCPADRGYPANAAVEDAPPANAGRSCYDTLGNSYRANLLALYGERGQACAVSPWGHRISAVQNPSRIVLYAEPLFIRGTMRDGEGRFSAMAFTGWHGKEAADNVAFLDGSVRRTTVDRMAEFETVTLEAMSTLPKNAEFLIRGNRFQMDVYPTPAARIWGKWEELSNFEAYSREHWPFTEMHTP